ncbi:hypothetical protein ACWGLF_25565 [Streptomyces puniciscabiei]
MSSVEEPRSEVRGRRRAVATGESTALPGRDGPGRGCQAVGARPSPNARSGSGFPISRTHADRTGADRARRTITAERVLGLPKEARP